MGPESTNKVISYTHYITLPLKIVACWEFFRNPTRIYQRLLNNVYLGFVLITLISLPTSLTNHLRAEWVDVMSHLDKIADGLPVVASIAIIIYFAIYKHELYELVDYMDRNFKWTSANGLTNATMYGSYNNARYFSYLYTACTLFSVSLYVILPVVRYLCFGIPLHQWMYEDVEQGILIALIFVRQCVAQVFVALALGQLGVLFASNSILLCGQLDLLCCSLRNSRYTALLRSGVAYETLSLQGLTITEDEEHNYLYNKSEMKQSFYHYDNMIKIEVNRNTNIDVNIETISALQDCARLSQIINEFKKRLERFVSPLLALRVIQVTLYLCTLLYAASQKFDAVTVEYLAAVALDIFVYCYYGTQLDIQSGRVTLAAYQSDWPSMAVSPRKILLNILISHKKPMNIRAGHFLLMDLQTFVMIIKTSFTYYTLLVSLDEKKQM